MRVAVLGAGVAGLTVAHRLSGAGHRCDVYERWPGLGGQVASMKIDGGDRLEHYYHHLFTSDEEIAALYGELGIAEQIEWFPSSVAVHTGGVTYPFTSPADLLRFSAMSPAGRLRMGAGVLALQRLRPRVGPLEGMSAREMVQRWLGPEAWEVVWGPLMRGKFAGRAEEISAAWLWSKLNVRRRIGGRESRRELLGYPRGGWQPLLEKLASRVAEAGGRVLVDRPALSLGREPDGGLSLAYGGPGSWRQGLGPAAMGEPQGAEDYDVVVATVPSEIFSALLSPGLREEAGADYMRRVEAAEYAAALCLVLELDRRFGPHYWINVADPELPFIGLIEHTNLVGTERYGGRHFLYVANYLEPGDPLLELDVEDLLAHYEAGLRRFNGGFERDWVRSLRRFSEPAAQPIVTVGYQERIPPISSGAAGLLLANTTQIYPEDRGTNYSVQLGERAARAVLDQAAGEVAGG